MSVDASERTTPNLEAEYVDAVIAEQEEALAAQEAAQKAAERQVALEREAAARALAQSTEVKYGPLPTPVVESHSLAPHQMAGGVRKARRAFDTRSIFV